MDANVNVVETLAKLVGLVEGLAALELVCWVKLMAIVVLVVMPAELWVAEDSVGEFVATSETSVVSIGDMVASWRVVVL